MKFRFTNPVTIKRGQIPKRAAVFVACLTGTTALMVVLMSFFTPPNTSYTEGVKYLWKKGTMYFAAPSETTKSDIRKRNDELMMLLAPSETCIEASQICAGVTVTARTASGTAEAGPFYGCLTTVPNPTWVYVKIATSGSLSFNVTLAPSADVDFAAWGPFTGPTCGAALNSAKLKACDYNATNGGTAALGNVVVHLCQRGLSLTK